jgi:hypothetical protein
MQRGAACDLAMPAAALPFRTTKDLDIVLCVEALDAAFVRTFREFGSNGSGVIAPPVYPETSDKDELTIGYLAGVNWRRYRLQRSTYKRLTKMSDSSFVRFLLPHMLPPNFLVPLVRFPGCPAYQNGARAPEEFAAA